MKKIIDCVTNDSTMSEKMQRGLSLVFLLISCVMIFLPYSTKFIIEWELSIKPQLISTFIAITLVAPLYARNILKWNKSIYTLISFILFLLVFASLIELSLGGNGINSGIIEMILICSIVLSWLGMRAIAGIAWILLFFAVALSIITNNTMMGFYGFIYVASAFIGLVLHSELSPGKLVVGVKEEFRISDETQNTIKDNINEATKTIMT